jgi:hypothetical protein
MHGNFTFYLKVCESLEVDHEICNNLCHLKVGWKTCIIIFCFSHVSIHFIVIVSISNNSTIEPYYNIGVTIFLTLGATSNSTWDFRLVITPSFDVW